MVVLTRDNSCFSLVSILCQIITIFIRASDKLVASCYHKTATSSGDHPTVAGWRAFDAATQNRYTLQVKESIHCHLCSSIILLIIMTVLDLSATLNLNKNEIKLHQTFIKLKPQKRTKVVLLEVIENAFEKRYIN